MVRRREGLIAEDREGTRAEPRDGLHEREGHDEQRTACDGELSHRVLGLSRAGHGSSYERRERERRVGLAAGRYERPKRRATRARSQAQNEGRGAGASAATSACRFGVPPGRSSRSASPPSSRTAPAAFTRAGAAAAAGEGTGEGVGIGAGDAPSSAGGLGAGANGGAGETAGVGTATAAAAGWTGREDEGAGAAGGSSFTRLGAGETVCAPEVPALDTSAIPLVLERATREGLGDPDVAGAAGLRAPDEALAVGAAPPALGTTRR